MERYAITTSGVYNHNLGEWVKASEAEAEIARLKARITELLESRDCFMQDNSELEVRCHRLEAEVERLKKYTLCYNGVPSEWIVKPEDL